MPVPTGRLALLAALLALAVAVSPLGLPEGLLVVNGVLVLVALVDWALAPRPDLLGVERELPAVVALAPEGEVVWRLRNPTSRPVRVDLADELAPSLGYGTRRARLIRSSASWRDR